uniref:V2 n=1 Tax=Turnip curly top virus TaxID=859650 RepID=A0A0S3JNL5_9GEMI|nr:V2 [Turnip curly top virus]
MCILKMIWIIGQDDKRVKAFRYHPRRFDSLTEYLLSPLSTHLLLARILNEKGWSAVPGDTDQPYSYLTTLKEEPRTPFQILKDDRNVEFHEMEVALSRIRLDSEDAVEEACSEESPVQQSSPVQSSSCET